MRSIVSPLDGFSTPFGTHGAVSAYAVAGFRPELVFDFERRYYRTNLSGSTFDNAVTFTRSGSATYVDSTGTLQTAADGEPRIGHHIWDGSEWVNEGLLLESESRTNLLLNSDTLATQDVTVTAVPYTLHFTGTGTVTLSGASTDGPLVGTGTGENSRVNLTFTPTAGTLTLTVSGTVTNAQLEAGATPSSYIPTNGSTVTRAAETLTAPSANLPWSLSAISIAMEGAMTYADTDTTNQLEFLDWRKSPTVDEIMLYLGTVSNQTGTMRFRQWASGVSDIIQESSPGSYSPGVNVPFSIASRHGATFINGAVDGTALTADTTPTALPDLSSTDLEIAPDFMGTIKSLRIWADDLGDSGIEEASDG